MERRNPGPKTFRRESKESTATAGGAGLFSIISVYVYSATPKGLTPPISVEKEVYKLSPVNILPRRFFF
jgi:hypothetical protein